MIENILNEINLLDLVSAKAASAVSSNASLYALVKDFNEVIAVSAINGLNSASVEVVRSQDLNVCKTYSQTKLVSDLAELAKKRGYKATYTIKQDSRSEEYCGVISLIWNS